MANVNKVILIGRLTRDPELRYTPSQVPVTELGLAINRVMGGGQDGERREETTFVDVTVWDRQAENCCQYLTKGQHAYVEGYLRLESWDDKNNPGQKRTKLSVVAQNVQFLDGGRRNDGSRGEESGGAGSSYEPRRAPTAARPATAAPAPARAAAPVTQDNDEDIPF